MNTRLVGAELFHADGQADRHEEANSRFSQFANTSKKLRRILCEWQKFRHELLAQKILPANVLTTETFPPNSR
jgi:hypothetical protein